MNVQIIHSYFKGLNYFGRVLNFFDWVSKFLFFQWRSWQGNFEMFVFGWSLYVQFFFSLVKSRINKTKDSLPPLLIQTLGKHNLSPYTCWRWLLYANISYDHKQNLSFFSWWDWWGEKKTKITFGYIKNIVKFTVNHQS